MSTLWPVISIILLVVFVACSNERDTTPKASIPGYDLVWSDEFNMDGPPNPDNWHDEQGFVRNQEAQWYQPENARCENGMLIIEGKRERKENPNYVAESENWKENRNYAEFTSSSLLTRGKHSWQFGRFEMRAKIDTRPGLWPAFWTLGIKDTWPHNGEIDIMEFYQDKILANVAWGDKQKYQAIWDSETVPLAQLQEKDPQWSDKFHVWRMDWDKTSIRLYLDDVLLNSTELASTINRDSEQNNPFLQPHYIIVNLAIGGTVGGDPSATTFPARYQIDYIRVYQKNN